MQGNSYGRGGPRRAKARTGLRAMVQEAVAQALRGRGRSGRGPVSRRRGSPARRSSPDVYGRDDGQDRDYGADVDEEAGFRSGSRGPLRIGHRM
jgi:hypothetical protein